MKKAIAAACVAILIAGLVMAISKTNDAAAPDGWTNAAPRDEVKPQFPFDPNGGPNSRGSLIARSDAREGLFGWWSKSFAVEGGKFYRFDAQRKTDNVPSPRRAAVVRIVWQDETGNTPMRDEPSNATYMPGAIPTAEPEYPTNGSTDAKGWTNVTGVYRAPSKAKRAVVELQFCWAANATVQWSDVKFEESSPPESRKVRLAAVHLRPTTGKTSAEKCRLFAPLIAEAAKRQADLVVLPETLTFYECGKTYAECAEPIPGPSTEYFGGLASQHNLYIVAGLLEREKHLVYNVAVLIGPDGKIVGKYRKVCLPRGEIESGIAPGDSYPVFDTRFGKVGMMICYDGFFPEVARHLSNNGAEVIAFPVWGCNPMLAAARACENHVYVVSSTYTDVTDHWMLTAIWGQDGQVIAQAKDWGNVIVTEVDLNKHLYWSSMGNFKAELVHRRPE